ncbi:MAG: hypothetical protein AAF824_00115 [Bacteroidota bacterium]
MEAPAQIPSINLYYLLSYAWNFSQGKGYKRVSGYPVHEVQELCVWAWLDQLALCLQTHALEQFHIQEKESEVIRGKIVWRPPLPTPPKIRCGYSVHTRNHPFMESLGSLYIRLMALESLSPFLRKRLQQLSFYFSTYQNHPLTHIPLPSTPSLMPLYHLSRCIVDIILPQEESGTHLFTNFLEEDQLMWKVFERYVKNFYKREQNTYTVHSRRFPWRNTQPFTRHDFSFLPQMETDVVLESEEKTIIIETKFYREAFRARFKHEKLISAHLYQLFAYLKNYPTEEKQKLRGCLLYPTLGTSFSLDYRIHQTPVRVLGLRLDTDPDQIHQHMMTLVAI